MISECFSDLGIESNRLAFGNRFLESTLLGEFLSVFESEEGSTVLLDPMLFGITMGNMVSLAAFDPWQQHFD